MKGLSRSRKGCAILLTVAVGLLGFITILFSTSQWGLGVTHDTVKYISTANNYLDGRGFLPYCGDLRSKAKVNYGPVYPAILIGIKSLEIQLEPAIRWLNAVLFGSSAALIGLLIWRYTKSLWVSLFGSWLFLASKWVLYIYTLMLTEAPFFFFVLLGLFFLVAYTDDSKRRYLIGFSIAFALGLLTRNTGAAWVATAFLGIFLFSKSTYRRKILDAAIFGIITLLPMLLWSIRNKSEFGTATGHNISLHPITLRQIQSFLSGFSAWFLPTQVYPLIRGICILIAAVVLVILGFVLVKRSKKDKLFDQANQRFAALPSLIAIYLVFFCALLAIAILFFVPELSLFTRIQSPIYVFGIILLLSVAYKLLSSAESVRRIYIGCTVFCILFAGYHGVRGAKFVLDAYRDGMAMTARQWRESEVIKHLESLPPGTVVFSCRPLGVYYLTGKTASYEMPQKYVRLTGKRVSTYESGLNLMAEHLSKHNGVVVLIHLYKGHKYPTEQELLEDIPLRLVAKYDDGVIYRLKQSVLVDTHEADTNVSPHRE